MTTQTTPAHAIELAELIDAGEASAESANAMRSLAHRVEALTQENNNLLAANSYLVNVDDEAAADIKTLTAERDALKVDAERYQKIRAGTRVQRGSCFEQIWFVLPEVKPIPGVNIQNGSVAQHLDDSIDAMKAAS